MSQLSTLYARKSIAQADASLDQDSLLRSVGIDPATPLDLDQMITEDAYCTLLETLAAAEAGRIAFHVRTGASMRCADMGAVGLAWKSSATLRDGFDRACRYISVLARPRTMEVVRRASDTKVILHRLTGATRLGAKLSNEASFCTVAAISRDSTQRDVAFKHVYCAHEQISDRQALEDYLQCPVNFNSDADTILIDNAELDQPNALGDDAISSFFDQHLSSLLSELGDNAPLSKKIKAEVAKSLSAGVPKLSDIAATLGMSARSLQRRLSEEGVAYQTIVDEARRELSEQLLRSTKYPLVEIAYLTGFAEQSAFTHAFKRWAGQTPRSFRQAEQVA